MRCDYWCYGGPRKGPPLLLGGKSRLAYNGPRVYELAVRAQAVAQATDVTELQVAAEGALANRSRKPAVIRFGGAHVSFATDGK